jgi:energy-coupling factor transporter ATP-binding protein EcfA2
MFSFDSLSQLGLPVKFPAFFPPELEKYRQSLSEATDTPDEYAAAYMLATGATATGAEVSACVQPGWCVRANLFMAVIGYKGSGKSTLADKVFAPLLVHEAELREQAVLDAADEPGEDEDGEEDAGSGRRSAKPPEPCVVVNDCTGPAVLQLLAHSQRQLLVNPDELSALFIRNNGGTDRQMWCELYDGRRRRQQRASSQSLSVTLDSPYICVLGGIQPDLVPSMHGRRGDDGFLDRLLLVGVPRVQAPAWPRDADDPQLNAAWGEAMTRLLHIEELSEGVIGGKVEPRFTAEAVEVCKALFHRLNDVVVAIGMHESQRGVVKKLAQHAVKLALLHRCFRWAAGEFGDTGDLGDIDADDATAACEAALFFLGRWLIWRPELRSGDAAPSGGCVGLAGSPGDDPALRLLAEAAAGAQSGIRLIERLVRYLRSRNIGPVSMPALLATGVFMPAVVEELRDACQWLADTGHGEWTGPHKGDFQLFEITKSTTKPRRRGRVGKAVLA